MSTNTTTDIRRAINHYGENELWNRIGRHTDQEPGGCWNWTGATNGGLPVLRLATGPRGIRKLINVHRVVWALENGRLHKGRLVRRTCGNGLCVNPEHLELAGVRPPQAINHRRGSQHPTSKLTEADVRIIRSTWKKRTDTVGLADRFGVSPDTIVNVVKRRSWRHVED